MTVARGADAFVYWNGQHVGKFRSIDQPTDRPSLETTGLGATDREYVNGGVRGNSASGTLLYDPNDSVAVDLINAIDRDDETDGVLTIEWLKGRSQGRRSGTVIVTQRGASVSVGEVMQVSLTLQFCGAVSGGF